MTRGNDPVIVGSVNETARTICAAFLARLFWKTILHGAKILGRSSSGGFSRERRRVMQR